MSAYRDYEERKRGYWVRTVVTRYCGHQESEEFYVSNRCSKEDWERWREEQKQERCKRCQQRLERKGLSGERGVGESGKD